MHSRYAVFFTPEPGSALAEFGADWLGWDPAEGVERSRADENGGLDLAALTKRPRKYGFHATLKPPFRLAESSNERNLCEAVDVLARRLAPVALPRLRLARIGTFLALVPESANSRLDDLAARVVQELEPFRAPLSAAEKARRRPERLTDRQRELLAEWGYPYVMEEFRFHMTLTGPLKQEFAKRIEDLLTSRLDRLPLRDVEIDALTLLGEGEDGCFRTIRRFPLAG